MLRRPLGAEPSAPGGVTMYAMLITFHSAIDLDSLAGQFTEYARALRGAEGLVLATWIQDGPALGRFYVFASRRAAEEYLAGDLMADLTANTGFTQFHIRRYAVLAELSGMTGTPRPLATRQLGAAHVQPRRGET